MDVQPLGAPLGARREGICSSTMPLYLTRGQWLPYRGHDAVKTTFLPLPFVLIWRSWVQIPRLALHFFKHNFFSKVNVFHSCQLSNQIIPPYTFCLVSHLTLPSFLTTSSSILRQKLHLSFLSKTTSRDLVMGTKPLTAQTWVLNASIHYLFLLQAGPALIVFISSMSWIGSI